ncbi:hypothetical protein KI387_001140, partial [Taxus chinensis]
VLSDPQKRAIYDRYGEEGLKGDGGEGQARGGSPNIFRSYSIGSDNPFAEFFGDTARSYSIENNPRSGEVLFRVHFSDLRLSRKGEPIENKLPCTLEQLYNGSTRKMKISRNIFILAGDLIFIIDEKPHDVYMRDGNDLIVTLKITLAQALTGYNVNLVTLDGRSLSIPITDFISPWYEKIVPREGMPISKDQGMRGNLHIKFDIKYPSRLTSEQKAGVNRFIGG